MPSTNHEHPTPTKKQKNNPASTPKKQKNNPASTPKKQKDNPTPPEEVKENPSPKEPKENATQDESTTSPTKSFAEHKHNSPGKPQIYLDLTPNKNEDYKLKVKRMFEDIQVSGLYVMDHSYMPMEPTAPHLIAQDALTRFGKFDVVIDNLFRPLLGAYRRQASVFLYSFLINKISHVFLFLGKFRDFVILNNVFVQEERHVSPEMINKEWAILRDNLPENIFVRAYKPMEESFTAVLIGSEGTPYHDGLFFFDVVMPPNPMFEPSLRYYWYYTQGVNSGHDNIELHSLLYNENVIVTSLQAMTNTMMKPPKHFEEFVVGHFRSRVSQILGACEKYMNGAFLEGKMEHRCSMKFREDVASCIQPLIEAFIKIGAKEAHKFHRLSSKNNHQV
ncbi:ubiquitin-conjugating enzyme/RWD-like protein [Tanacetum coccineum]